MKKKITLTNLEVNSFKTSINEEVRGGADTTLVSVEPEFCDFTSNRWCFSNYGETNCGVLCTQTR